MRAATREWWIYSHFTPLPVPHSLLAGPCEVSALYSLVGAFSLVFPYKLLSLLVAKWVRALSHRCLTVTSDMKVAGTMRAPPMIERPVVAQFVLAIRHIGESLTRQARFPNEAVTLI